MPNFLPLNSIKIKRNSTISNFIIERFEKNRSLLFHVKTVYNLFYKMHLFLIYENNGMLYLYLATDVFALLFFLNFRIIVTTMLGGII